MTKIYKYFSQPVLELVFARNGYCSLKCSLPQDYNDPFELFLGVDLEVSTDLLATYRESINELPQLPTTCFSRSPVVSPMWAHYAQNHSGFVLEFDVERLNKNFEHAALRDVTYKDSPDSTIGDFLARSAVTMKPRHAVWLQQAVLSEAYFSKQTAWRYEEEHRLVVPIDQVENIDGSMILFIPMDCVTAIICGSKFLHDGSSSKELAKSNSLRWFQEIIGTSNSQPFFVDSDQKVCIFKDGSIVEAAHVCGTCFEPTGGESKLCAWCRITDKHELAAARANPFRVMAHYGILEEYFDGVAEIERRPRK